LIVEELGLSRIGTECNKCSRRKQTGRHFLEGPKEDTLLGGFEVAGFASGAVGLEVLFGFGRFENGGAFFSSFIAEIAALDYVVA
jgi:hypothetical protein